jgi:carbonic anhydrase
MKTPIALHLPAPLSSLAVAVLLGLSGAGPAAANGTAVAPGTAARVGVKQPTVATKPTANEAAAGDPSIDTHAAATKIKAALEGHGGKASGVSLVIGEPERKAAPTPASAPHAAPVAPRAHAAASGSLHAVAAAPREHSRASAAIRSGHAAPEAHGAKGHEPHWSYEGEYGPDKWAAVKPEFNACAVGKRQSPVHIQETGTLQGPAEPLQFNYRASGGSVVNNGHTIQVDLEPGNTLSVRGSTYQLLQFHFHHPAEEKVNYKGFSMVAHLVHKNDEGQLAVVAVLIDPGAANDLVHKVWTHMPLDSGDRVRLPAGLIDMNTLLPTDQRYYQFMGSLTTPPCTEGVLWNVIKAPVTVSKEQLKLFAQLFPMNARPVQALNGRVVREAQ